MLPHAPGVQMANIPEDGVTLKDDSAIADEADPDKRLPQHVKDKMVIFLLFILQKSLFTNDNWTLQIEGENEFEERKSGNRDEAVFEMNNINNTNSTNNGTAKNEGEDAMEVDEAKESGEDSKVAAVWTRQISMMNLDFNVCWNQSINYNRKFVFSNTCLPLYDP